MKNVIYLKMNNIDKLRIQIYNVKRLYMFSIKIKITLKLEI